MIKVICLAICLALHLSCICSQAEHLPTEPYIVAGDLVTSAYKAYTDELSQFYVNLIKPEKTSPELIKKLSLEPPKITKTGYQILPKIVEISPPPPTQKDKLTESPFSWPRTLNMLENDRKKLRAYEAQLEKASIAELPEIISNYQKLDKNQIIIKSQIDYNRMWQSDIALHRAKYDESTIICNDLKDKKLAPDQAVQTRLTKLMAPPDSFIKLIEISPKHFVIQIEVITDIEDEVFWDSFRKAVCKYWHIEEGAVEYEVKLNLNKVSPLLLYRNEAAPARGDKIDLQLHVPRFPTGYAIVTSGSDGTYYSRIAANDKEADRSYVVFGAGETKDSVLAHEFGHLLQLNDAYFRCYRDIGSNGFEVIEVVPDMTDLMSAPGAGRVKAHHFEILIKALLTRKN